MTFFDKISRAQDEPVILGLRLRPFTLGHLFLLREIGSPFVGCETEASDDPLQDFFLAVFICAHDHLEARRLLGRWWSRWFFRYWGRRVARRHRVRAEFDRFNAWIEASQSAPPFFTEMGKDAPGTCGAPAPWVKLMFALHILHLDYDDALSLPIVKLNALHGTWGDWTGRIELSESPHFMALWQFAEEEDRKRFNPDGTRKLPDATADTGANI